MFKEIDNKDFVELVKVEVNRTLDLYLKII